MKTLHRIEGYLAIEDCGLIGDGATDALIGRDGTLAWLCLPRFDSPPLFCSLLDRGRGGSFRIAPDEVVESGPYYERDSAVLVTEMRTASGCLRLRECCPLLSGADLTEDLSATRRELLRSVTVTEGTVRLQIELDPRGRAEAEQRDGWLRIRCKAQALGLYDSLCSRAGALGLLPEEIDPSAGAFLGNYPQAFSHIGVIASGVNLARQLKDSGVH